MYFNQGRADLRKFKNFGGIREIRVPVNLPAYLNADCSSHYNWSQSLEIPVYRHNY